MTAGQEGTVPDGDPCVVETDGEELPGQASSAGTKILLFLGILAAGAVLIAMAFLAMDLPQCQDPVLDWIPCIGPCVLVPDGAR